MHLLPALPVASDVRSPFDSPAEGYHIFLNCSRSFDALEETRQEIEKIGTCTLVPGDIGNPDTVRKIFHTIAKTCDHLDVLVNNAGISHIGLLMDMTDEDWDKVLSSNLSSVFYCCRAAIPPMLSHGSGRIINISSMWGVNGASCEAAYSASKAGVGGSPRHLPKNWQEVKFQSMLLHVVSLIPK